MLALNNDLKEGKALSKSFKAFPEAFDAVTISLIAASEEAGNLETTLKDISLNLKKEIEFDDKVKAALTYPLLVLIVFTGVLLLILVFVIPRIAVVFTRLKMELPLPTKILIAVSNFLISYAPAVLALVIILVFIGFFLYRTQKKALLNLIFSLPGLSKLAKEIDLARFTHSFSLLLSGGITATEALGLCQEVVTKKEVFNMIVKSKEELSSGKKLSEAFEKEKKVVPSTMIRITAAGEESGTLEKSMQDLSEYFDSQIQKTLKTVTTLIEPVMLVVVGVLVGGMMLSIIAPIYQMIGQIRGR